MHFTSGLQKHGRTQQVESANKEENLNYFLIFFPALIQPSPIHAISTWVILQKLIYTAVHNSHKSVAGCILLSNPPAIKFSEGLPKNVQAERVNVLAYHIHCEYIFLYALPTVL